MNSNSREHHERVSHTLDSGYKQRWYVSPCHAQSVHRIGVPFVVDVNIFAVTFVMPPDTTPEQHSQGKRTSKQCPFLLRLMPSKRLDNTGSVWLKKAVLMSCCLAVHVKASSFHSSVALRLSNYLLIPEARPSEQLRRLEPVDQP